MQALAGADVSGASSKGVSGYKRWRDSPTNYCTQLQALQPPPKSYCSSVCSTEAWEVCTSVRSTEVRSTEELRTGVHTYVRTSRYVQYVAKAWPPWPPTRHERAATDTSCG